ncbi:SusC/RagA family TonB-linked outer membrane protein [Wenyingzhuangia marina]|uniref:TonB-linked outer membrane protein, SusC/RagA family n=1 Tax=Wenyingzhuangia marina TaxID=1195760 RepID=A0A1M5TV44_9FLAO|nr:SusC/RagA family TonB-linked outer membrane protein [Wenyingzhuangia marina]GGF70903.1 SusC/RagA family TonB-linked outer membrane protein [Wenyingzhuangia marina]SHH54558.1 TonB-linked outer membrane protein, SusC/RagA family [Wenyingzhuangia marina]
MRYIQLKLVLCFVVIASFPFKLIAQENKIDSLAAQINNGTSLEVEKNQSVQIAFRKVQEKDLLGGVSFVNLPEIMNKNYTTYSLDGLQTYIGGFNGSIWGNGGALVLVDGIPRSATSVQAIEIEQISVLKGVSAVALYGSRAAKGVIYITTKKGKNQKQQIDVRVNTGVNTIKSTPQYLGSAEYMNYYNQARQNDGLGELYDYETIYNHASGNNPYRYPNVDYYSSDYLRDISTQQDANLQISGGNDIARYYTNVSFMTAGDFIDFGEAKNNRTQRFNVRGNVDIDITNKISATIGANAIYYNGTGVNANYWGGAATLRPNRFAPLIPISMIESGDVNSLNQVQNSTNIIDGKYLLGGTQLDQTNPFAGIYAGGSNDYTSRQFQFNTAINADLNDLLEGLSFRTMFGVDYESSYNQAYNNNYATYEPKWNNYAGFDQISSLTKYGQDATSGTQNISNSTYGQTISFSGQFDYIKSFEGNNISASLIASAFQQSRAEVYHKVSNGNLGLHLGYNYKSKYYADFNGAIVHSAKLAEGNRNAFSPTVSVGWRLSEENFLKDSDIIDNLKLSVSAGILNTDLDISDYYLYESIYTQTDGAWFSWRDGSLNRSTDSRRGENLDLTFAKREEFNVGLEASFFKNFINFNGSFFANKMTGNVTQATVLYPSYFTTGWPNSSFIPNINYNDDKRIGAEFNLKFNKKIAEVDWSLGLTAMYYDTEASKRAESFENEYQYRQGKPLDGIWGLKSDGFFMDANDIASSPSQTFGEVFPGDIKYKDQNNDGVIDNQDQVYLGKGGWSGAPLTFGVNLTTKWKDLTFFALATGQFGANAMKNSSYFWIDGDDKYSVIVRDSWTEETKETATYPRLTTLNGDNNFRSSDFWMYSTNRINLSKVQVTYDFPTSILKKTFVKELGIYMSGANLLTISPERETMELNVGSSPQTRFYNLGIKALF